jgi:two-component system cell cycle sensor histidine kinase/response regulator CckA
MGQKIKIFVLVSMAVIWLLAFAFLGYSVHHPLQWLALSTLAILTIILAFLLTQSLKEQTSSHEKIQFTNTLTTTLAGYFEMLVFDEQGRTIYTTHPHLYPYQKEFLRKFFLRVNPSPETIVLKKWISEHIEGEVILTSGGNGLGQNQKRYMVRVTPMNITLTQGKHYLLVTIIDLTKYLDGLSSLKSSNQNLENFINNAPFGVFYSSPSKHFVGMNDTLAKWLNIEKDKLIGQKISEFIDDFDHRIVDEKIRILNLKPFKKNGFKALWFPPNGADQKIQASVICKIDQNMVMKGDLTGAYLNEATFANARIPAAIVDHVGNIVSFNPSFITLFDAAIVDFGNTIKIGDNLFSMLDLSTHDDFPEKLNNASHNRDAPPLLEVVFKGGKIHATAYVSIVEHSLDPNQPTQLMLQFIDISEQKRLEQQFIQSQKMQAVGQLAGGIAHDFNNLLTAMIGFCDLLLQRYMPNDASYTDVIQIKQNANRAANLVRQLLAFSRQQSLQPRMMSITDVISELSALLRRLIGANIELIIKHGRDLWAVRADVSQFEQVIINLVVNARDAMFDGGQLSIQTSNFHCAAPLRLGHEILSKGDYVLIEVTDTGQGIPADVIERIFEPFFSTKEVGAGTGLGLSTVYGIVKQTGGFIYVESAVNVGTKFKLYIPRYHHDEQKLFEPEKKPKKIPPIEKLRDLSGGESILLVEDEDAVRMFSARALREKGYIVTEAEHAEAALNLINDGKRFDLLITDVVMPKMDGPTLTKKIRDICPDIRTIFISGYTEDTFRKNLGHNEQIHFLGKPFNLKDLAEKVKSVLE